MLKNKFTKLCLLSLIITNLAYGDAKDDINHLNHLYSQGKYKEAIEKSKRFISLYPESNYNKNLTKRIGLVSYLGNDFQNAKLYFEKYLTDYKLSKKEKREAHSYLYRIETLYKNTAKADYYRTDVIEDKELWEKTVYETGILLLNDGNNEEALKYFNSTISTKGENQYKGYLYKALALHNLGRYEEGFDSLNIYGQSQMESKDLPLATYLYGVLSYKSNQTNNAITYLESGVKNFPNDTYTEKGRVTLIEIYLNINNLDRALELFGDLKEKESSKLSAKIIGNYFVTNEEFLEAISYFEFIGNNMDAESRYAYAYSLFRIKNYKKAIEEFNKIQEEKYQIDVRYYQIISYYELKNYKKVLEYEKYLKDYEIDSKKYNDVRGIFANSTYETKEYERSALYYNEIYKDYPEPINIYKAMIAGKIILNEEMLNSLFIDYKENFKDDNEHKKDIYLLMGDYFFQTNQIEKSQDVYIDYLTVTKDQEITEKLIDLLINQKKYAEAIKYLNTLENTDETLYLKSIAYMGITNYKKADENLELLMKGSKDKEILEKAQYTSIKNNFLWEKYEEVLKEGNLYSINKNTYRIDDVIDVMGITYYRQGDFIKARETFEKLEKYIERYSYAKYQIADTYFIQKNYEKAVELFTEILKDKNNSIEYREPSFYNLVQSYLFLEESEKFLKESDNFLKEYPESSYKKSLIITRGRILNEQGSLETALGEYEKLYELEGSSKEKDIIAENIINIYISLNDKEKQMLWINKINDKYKKAYRQSLYLREEGMEEQAINVEKILVESEIYKDYAYRLLGDASYIAKDYKKSYEYFSNINNMQATSYKDYALYKIGEIYLKESKNKEAIVEFTKVFTLYPQSKYKIMSQIKIAETYEILDRKPNALQAYKEIDANPESHLYHEFLVEKILYLLLLEENQPEARIYYNELLRLNETSALRYKDYIEPLVEKTQVEEIQEASAEEVEKVQVENIEENKPQEKTEETVKEIKN